MPSSMTIVVIVIIIVMMVIIIIIIIIGGFGAGGGGGRGVGPVHKPSFEPLLGNNEMRHKCIVKAAWEP